MPLVWNGMDNSVAQTPLRQLQGDHLYAEAVAYGAGMMIDFMTTALALHCGNGALDLGEQCDDGNTSAGDCCSPLCQFEAAGTGVPRGCGGVRRCRDLHRDVGKLPRERVRVVHHGVSCGGRAVRHRGDVLGQRSVLPARCAGRHLHHLPLGGRGVRRRGDVRRHRSGLSRRRARPRRHHVSGRRRRLRCPRDVHGDVGELSCPPDGFVPAGTSCRASAGSCDVAETCTGTSATCPANGFVPSGTSCRASAGSCDIAETCTGTSAGCPADTLAPAGTSCRGAAGSCDVAETCTGSTTTCPADGSAPDGTSCDDGNACTAADTCTGGTCAGSGDVDGCADDFLCYQIKAPPLPAIPTVSLIDQFETTDVTLTKMRNLCTPADKAGEGVLDPVTHLVTYTLRSVPGTPRHVPRNVTIVNQLGTLALTTMRPELLLVPAAKDLVSPPPPPPFASHAVDHYKCYKAKVTPGTTKFPRGITKTIGDQLRGVAGTFAIKKRRKLCTPVDANGEEIKNATVHLVCYSVKAVAGTPPHQRASNVQTASQFGALAVGTTKEKELCIPSTKVLVP